jgi:xylose isomerase
VVGTGATTLLLCEDVGEPNVGVLLDTGHALLAQENLAEVTALLARSGRLFHVHFNDNYRMWDEDMVPGSVHLLEFLEMLYWLDRVGYDGWLMFDAQSPGYEPTHIMKTSLAFVKGLAALLERLDIPLLGEALANGDALTCISRIQRAMFGEEVVSSLVV